MASLLWCCALLAVACMLAEPSRAQFGGPPPPPSIPPVKSDLPYIRCGVCEALAKNAYRQVKAAREELKPGKKVGASMGCAECHDMDMLRSDLFSLLFLLLSACFTL